MRDSSLIRYNYRRAAANAHDETRLPFVDGPMLRNRTLWSILARASAAVAACLSFTGGWPAHAGDILRGGAPSGARRSGGGGGTAAVEAAKAQVNAKDALARTSQALQSVKKMQEAARQIAQSKDNPGRDPNHPGLSLPKVPDGLAPGGLEVAPGIGTNPALWQGAQLPRAISQTEVVIRQTSPQAVLHWQTFNVGKKTTVNFDQRDGGAQKSQWVAFNKITDPSGVPSQILGQIKADGQVYLINPNGIIFGGTSQVNTHALVASSLPINDNLLQRGLLNNPDQQFLFTSLPLAAGANGTPAFTPPASPAGKYGDVEVQAGARLSAPTTPERVGGRIALIGTNVKNEGTISTPDGQTILAAGNQVAFAPHPSTDASLRGLDTYLGTVNAGSGQAVNTGWISAARGSTTIAGKDVQQLGVIESTTSVTLNGRIDLLAEYGSVPIKDGTTLQLVLFPQSTGTATLGPGAALQILPEWSSDETATGTSLPLKSSIKIDALAIHLAENSTILAPSGSVELNAGTWKLFGQKNVLTYDRGQVFLDRGAMVNVAGSTDISVPITQNILRLTLRGAELADSPLQRDGLLRGTAINVDVRKLVDYNGSSWVGTPLANVAGYVGLIDRKVGELTTGGGTIKVNAGESVVLQPGSKFDVSGGYINFQGGLVETTRVRSGGRIMDISEATPDRIYEGIYTGESTFTHEKYGISQTFTQPLALLGQHYEPGYVQGGSGGTIAITAPAMAIDGELLGQVVAGTRQLRDTATTSQLPTTSTLSLAFLAQQSTNPYPTYSPTPPSIRFDANAHLAAADDFSLDISGAPAPLRQDRKDEVILSPSLFAEAGFGHFSLENSDGNISIPAHVNIHGQPGGSFSLRAANVTIDGRLSVPGGDVQVNVFNLSPALLGDVKNLAQSGDPTAVLPPADGTRGHFALGGNATINTAGLVVDDRIDPLSDTKLPLALAGGSISIEAYSAQLSAGSVLDVSGGVAWSSNGKQAFGKGGKLSIKVGQDPDSPSTNGGSFVLNSELKGYSGSVGGALTIQVAQVQVGGDSAPVGVFWVAPEFFNQGGFSSFTLSGTGRRGPGGESLPGVVIAPGTLLEPQAKVLAAEPNAGGHSPLTLQPVEAPEGVRAPVSLTFSAPGIRDTLNGGVSVRGDLILGQGAVIHTDARASVTLSGDTADIQGSIIAPGGTIAISGGRNSSLLFGDETKPLVTVHIGAESRLSTAGKVLLTPDPRGYRTGSVVAGGNITISGNIAAEKGAILDVSGATGILDLAPAYSAMGTTFTGAINGDPVTRQSSSGVTGAEYRGTLASEPNANGFFGSASLSGTPLIPTTVDSNAGSITLQGQWLLVSDATLIGKAGGPNAAGGSLTISSGRFFDINQIPSPTDVGLVVSQSGSFLTHVGRIAIGQPLFNGAGIARNAGSIAVNDFQPGGFSAVNLKGVVQFTGPVDLTATRQLAVGDGGYIFADGAVRLTAPYVALGTVFQTPLPEIEQVPIDPAQSPLPPLPTFGPGSLTVKAQLIDVGNLSLQNIGKLNLFADGGDIRGAGTLDVAGDIFLRAGQIYPVSASKFMIVAYDHTANNQTVPGSVTIAGSGTRPLPLSAGGTLSIYASKITQGGTLRAPFGTINLGWDGAGTSPKDLVTGAGVIAGRSVPIAQQITLSPGSVTSVSAIDPATGLGLTIPYGLILNESSWIDPTGLDITATGLPMKMVNIGGLNIAIDAGSLIDLRGGGDLYAYRWVQGNGGSRDLLNSTTSFAVIPGYDPLFAPYGGFNANTTSASAVNLGGDPGYINSKLAPGDRVYLGASQGLPAGVYTLLPARYALLDGAFLVTPQKGSPLGNYLAADGSSQVAGYRFNAFENAAGPGTPLYGSYEIAPSSVVRARAEYADYSGNVFLTLRAEELGLARAQRLAQDAGYLRLTAQQSLALNGDVAATAASQARAGWIDISSPLDFILGGTGAAPQAGKIVLDSARLGSYGAESLLIGGTRQVTSSGTVITVAANNVLVDNAGTGLSAADIILVAKKTLDVTAGSAITARGPSNYELSNLLIGSATTAGSGDGVLLRVSGDTSTSLIRSGVSTSLIPAMTIGAGAQMSGTSLTLDSTNATVLDPTASLLGKVIALNSGRISLRLDDSVALNPSPGLVFEGAALNVLQSALAISLTSYSTLDLYGNGVFQTSGQLALHAAEIRGFTNGGTITLSAPGILLDNRSNGVGPGAVIAPSGTLVLDAATVQLGAGTVKVDQFADVQVRAPGGLVIDQTGALTTQGNLSVATALVTGTKAANHSITAGGTLTIQAAAGSPAAAIGGAGLGATLNLIGTSIAIDTGVLLPSGALSLQATTGSVIIGGTSAAKIDVGGTEQRFYDRVQFTNAGRVSIVANTGNVTLGADSNINVAAAAGGGDAGSISISAQQGAITLLGTLAGQAGAGGKSGSFTLDVSTLADASTVDSVLNAASFGRARTYRVRSGDVTVTGLATSHSYRISADQGSITIAGDARIDASGATGGEIALSAFGNVSLLPTAELTVRGADFDNAGKGGTITIEAGSQRNGVVGVGAVDLQAGSLLDLSVDTLVPGSANVFGTSAYLGQFSGKLHLRAPQNAAGTDLFVNPIAGTVIGASSVLVEGYRLFDLTGTTGVITNSGSINAAGGTMVAGNNVQGSINANAQNFLGSAGTTTAGYTAMLNRLLGADPNGLLPVFVLAPGAEIIHRTGDLTLGATNSTQNADWDLSSFRYGPKGAAGVLTMRAAGNLVFYNALSDGFTPDLPNSNASWLYFAPLSTQNPLLPVNTQSWSYRLTAGADLAAASFSLLRPTTALGATAGLIQLGKNNGTNISNSNGTSNPAGNNASTRLAVANRFQVIRTGSGDISLNAGRSVQLLNNFATIYTAGTQVANPTMDGAFDIPQNFQDGGSTTLGAVQQDPPYPAQYSMAGGNVSIFAQENIEHLTRNTGGQLIADSQREMPVNWLYRRGYIDPATGLPGTTVFGDVASTTWWVDFSNFFQGVGALGGGNVSLRAGQDISNVDAVAPTNARMPNGIPDAANLLELGGGDVLVQAGRNIDAGVYYVERGQGTLNAGGQITTNSTRSPSLTNTSPSSALDSTNWLPTTLFLGKGGFDVSAQGDVLLGPVANPFLLPIGVNNSFWLKTYFSTYAPESFVNVSSLGGKITLRESSTPPGGSAGTTNPLLQTWFNKMLLLAPANASFNQPWLRLGETNILPFSTVSSLLPPTLRATAFSGDINLVGNLTLSPSANGTLDLFAEGAINGLQPMGLVTINGVSTRSWGTSRINVSDADPDSLPGITTPFAYQSLPEVGTTVSQARQTRAAFLNFIDILFAESGATLGNTATQQTKLALHAPNVLHRDDPEPLRLYSSTGDISGLTLFSPKAATIVAGNDITDVAFYIQNTNEDDISTVASGRDIVLYNANSALRVAANQPGNTPNSNSGVQAGDIQVTGEGTLEVLAGRTLDLGTGSNNANGTGVGITSVGNARNPYLPFTGASLVIGAGIGPSAGLSRSTLDFESLLNGASVSPALLAELISSDERFGSGVLSGPDSELLALELFYSILRDAGRDYLRDPSTGYAEGFAAISNLFPEAGSGDVFTRGRDIRTRSGGSISIFAPGGELRLANSTIGNPLAPPGIITESGGDVSIFTDGDVSLGIGRIFTLRGGNQVIWSSAGNIAAGSAAKTVQSAPPTRVLIDPQSADVTIDLAGLATGGGIGVLATRGGIPPGSVDLIAPTGVVDAGDAGIRATGNLNIAAVQILNADNIQVAGVATGIPPAATVAAPNLGGITAANNASGAANAAANEVTSQQRHNDVIPDLPSVITVEVLGYKIEGEDPESAPRDSQ